VSGYVPLDKETPMPEGTQPAPSETAATTSTGPSSEIRDKIGYGVEDGDSPEEGALNPPGTRGTPEEKS
jgi:hypothetical protein